MLIKICGITRAADARAAVAAGADAVGFVFARSPRQIDPTEAAAIGRASTGSCLRVGVFVNTPFDEVRRAIDIAALDVVQFHGDEGNADCRRAIGLGLRAWKRLDVRDNDTAETIAERGSGLTVDAILVDPGKGDGRTFRWALAAKLPGRLIVAGGLTADNVADAIRVSRPWGVDVSSGVETAPGIKSEELMRTFVDRVRTACERE